MKDVGPFERGGVSNALLYYYYYYYSTTTALLLLYYCYSSTTTLLLLYYYGPGSNVLLVVAAVRSCVFNKDLPHTSAAHKRSTQGRGELYVLFSWQAA